MHPGYSSVERCSIILSFTLTFLIYIYDLRLRCNYFYIVDVNISFRLVTSVCKASRLSVTTTRSAAKRRDDKARPFHKALKLISVPLHLTRFTQRGYLRVFMDLRRNLHGS